MISSETNNYFAIVRNINTGDTRFILNSPETLAQAKNVDYELIDYAPNMSEAQRKIFGRPLTH